MGRKNKRHSVELKQKVVREFLDEKASATEVCKKYDISDTKTYLDYIVIAKDGFYSIRSNHKTCFESI